MVTSSISRHTPLSQSLHAMHGGQEEWKALQAVQERTLRARLGASYSRSCAVESRLLSQHTQPEVHAL